MAKQKDTELYKAFQQEREQTITLLANLCRELNAGNTDANTLEMAGIFFGVFNDHEEGIVDRELPQSVRAFCEHLLGEACHRMDIHAWNSSLLSPLAWMVLSGIYAACGGDESVVHTIKYLCTKSEYAEFLTRYGLEGGEPEEDTKWELDEMAAFKIARYLADPRTDPKTKRELGAALFELSSETEVHVDHPALAERAASIMFESVNDESDAPTKRIYEHIRAMLDELPDMPEGGAS